MPSELHCQQSLELCACKIDNRALGTWHSVCLVSGGTWKKPPVANMQPKSPHVGAGGKRILNMSSSCQQITVGGQSAWALLVA